MRVSPLVFLVLGGLWIGVGSARAETTDVLVDELPVANRAVLEVIERIEPGGGYEWKSTGVPFDIPHGRRVVLKQTTANGTYCSGVTFTAVMGAATRIGLLDDKPFDDVKRFQRHWYGTNEASAETQCVFALEQLGIGHAVEHDDALPGDFVQFWRARSGHSVVFLAWVTDEDGRRIGLEYWSSQKATDGIGVHTEYFAGVAGHDGAVDPERLHVGRLWSPEPGEGGDEEEAGDES